MSRTLEERRVFSEQGEDGTANLHGLNLPPAETNRAMRRINRLARALKAKGDRRRIDQIRADILLDLLTGKGQPDGSSDRGVVEIRVDMTTLAGIDDQPGEIPGLGPIIADVARKMVDEASDSEWRIIPVDENGQPVGVVTTRRRPTTAQKRSWRHGIRPVSSPDVACPPRNVISTMRSNGQKPTGPRSESSDHYVDTTTSTITATDGN